MCFVPEFLNWCNLGINDAQEPVKIGDAPSRNAGFQADDRAF